MKDAEDLLKMHISQIAEGILPVITKHPWAIQAPSIRAFLHLSTHFEPGYFVLKV